MLANLIKTLTALALAACCARGAIQGKVMDAIHSGVAWYDDRGAVVSAHGAGIIREGDRFYLFGDFKRDHSNEFAGFSCYSSADLMNWKFENIALAVQKDGRLGPNRVGERPKVMKCPKTGEQATKDDPAVYMTFDTPPALGERQKDPTHTANFGVKLQEKLKSIGVASELVYPGAPDVRHAGMEDFLIGKLRE